MTSTASEAFNPYNAKATFAQKIRMQRFLNTILILSCWYLSDRVLSDEYPHARVANKCSGFLNDYVLETLATSNLLPVVPACAEGYIVYAEKNDERHNTRILPLLN